jgi:hypothetical protein
LISACLVALDVGIAEREVAVESERSQGGGVVPRAGWVAADRAFDNPKWSQDDGDELHQALSAASPHIRADELDRQLQALAVKISDIPLFGRRNNGMREGLELAILLLTERKEALEAVTDGREDSSRAV